MPSRIGVNTERPLPYAPACPTIDALKTAEPKQGGYVWQGGVPNMGGTYTLVFPNGDTQPVLATDAPFWFDAPLGTKLLRPGYTSDAGTFTREYIASKAPFGVIRLMNWMMVNEDPGFSHGVADQYWSDPNKGAPVEPWLEWADETGKSLWLTIPRRWSDEAVEAFARGCAFYVRDNPNVHLYVEHANEVWNSGTKVGRAIWEDSQRQGKPRLQIHAQRTVEIGRIFKKHFPADRVHPQMGCQLSNIGEATLAVRWAVQQFGKGQFDLSVAPYLGNPGTPSDATPQGYANYLLNEAKRWRDNPDTSSTVKGFAKWRALAAECGGSLTAYEYGVDLKMDRDVPDRAASQHLPQMEECIQVYTDVLMREGFEVACYYKDFSQWNGSGVWGLSNNPRKIDGPKFTGAAKAAAKHQFPHPVPTPTPTPTPSPTPTPTPTTKEDILAVYDRMLVQSQEYAALKAKHDEIAATVKSIGEGL